MGQNQLHNNPKIAELVLLAHPCQSGSNAQTKAKKLNSFGIRTTLKFDFGWVDMQNLDRQQANADGPTKPILPNESPLSALS